jgi:hypothetical protein
MQLVRMHEGGLSVGVDGCLGEWRMAVWMVNYIELLCDDVAIVISTSQLDQP